MGQAEHEGMPGINTGRPQEAGTPARFVDQKLEAEQEGLTVVLSSPAPPCEAPGAVSPRRPGWPWLPCV